ncbi:glycoside hydrolase family 72 protein [Hyaloscypha bicolor E]|uniref:1,3-beta-glucanosyltransferase n=1 Tax=Hyaloscypha bicolor E TaxID=1095630 RepID=A0A2J6SPN4_9HELO|nr:glycoside hydrolase family 72 protein [Hyaloscypha bicolor E]PMD52703.1 glycoside hydrolase family 72 protein [Hyaloscypha bicolor E]
MWVFLVFAGAPFLVGLFPVTAAIPTISAIHSKFFDSNGNQFFIKGVIYQPGGSASLTDPLINTAQCALDAALMSDLGVNTISVYYAGSGDDHTGCMSAFEDAGIYVMVGLASPLTGINRTSPAWTTSQLSSFSAVMDNFASFDNTLGFFVGNEVVNDMTVSDVAPYVKAAALDLKSYRDSKGYRQIPVGYSGAAYRKWIYIIPRSNTIPLYFEAIIDTKKFF